MPVPERPADYPQLLAWPPPDDDPGLRRLADTPQGYSRYQCIKCGTESGDDWSQCRGKCPSMQSPHFDQATLDMCLGTHHAAISIPIEYYEDEAAAWVEPEDREA